MREANAAVMSEFEGRLDQYSQQLFSALDQRFGLAKASKRLKALPLETEKNAKFVADYKRHFLAVFGRLRPKVAAEVKHKLSATEKFEKARPPKGGGPKPGEEEELDPDEVDVNAVLDSLDLSDLKVTVDDTADLGAEAFGETARLALAQLGVSETSDIVNLIDQRAAEWAEKNAAELVSGIDDATRNMVRSIVAEGLSDGLTKDEIAENIADIDSYPFSDERAELIANTEIAAAHSQGALEGYRQAQDNGVNVQKEWYAEDGCCDDCDDNDAEGPIDVDDDFPSGDDAPPAHPNCRCVIVPVVGESEEADQGDDEE